MADYSQSQYSRTFNSFSGADIKVSFGNVVIGELASITYSVTREKAPIFTMGDPNPRSFSRGKRGIAGSLVFTIFDRDALYGLKNSTDERTMIHRSGFNSSDRFAGNDLKRPHEDYSIGLDDNFARWATKKNSHYSDEIPPFDITITFLNEYGNAAAMSIYGVELTNEGMGLSIDDITTEKACSFVARGLSDMNSGDHGKPW